MREMKPENKTDFVKTLEGEKWKEVYQAKTVNEKTEKLHEIISTQYNDCFPEIEVKLNKNMHAKEGFMTRGLLISRSRGEKMHAKWVKKQQEHLLGEYTEYDQLYRKAVRASKIKETETMYKDNYKNTKKIWQLTNDMLNRKKKGNREIAAIYCADMKKRSYRPSRNGKHVQ